MKKLLKDPAFHFILMIVVIAMAHGFRYMHNPSSQGTEKVKMNNKTPYLKASFNVQREGNASQTEFFNSPGQNLLFHGAILLSPEHKEEPVSRKYPPLNR